MIAGSKEVIYIGCCRDDDITKSPLENSFADGYKKEQVTDLVRLFLTCDDDNGKRLIPEREEQNLRDCLDFLFGESLLLHSLNYVGQGISSSLSSSLHVQVT